MSQKTEEALLLPFIEIPASLLEAFKGDSGVLLVGPTGCGKTHVLRRLVTLSPECVGLRTILSTDLRGSAVCKEVAQIAQHSPVAAYMQAMGAIEAWSAFSEDAGIPLDQAKAVFPLVVIVERGKVIDQVWA